MQFSTLYVGPPNTYQYLGGQVALMGDPGNNDGAVSSTISGLSFANTGPADDVTLATGSLLSGKFSLMPAPGNPYYWLRVSKRVGSARNSLESCHLDPAT
jgi:hypothetical protein